MAATGYTKFHGRAETIGFIMEFVAGFSSVGLSSPGLSPLIMTF
jgi:hypothetical protein